MSEQCLWCKADVNAGAEVWIERQTDFGTPEEWSGVFCGDEHAAKWVAKPFEASVYNAEQTWKDTAFMFGCLSILAVLAVVTAIGLVVSVEWLLDATH